jgi:hypothetical protein
VEVLFARPDHSDALVDDESTESRSFADLPAIVVELAAFHFDRQVVQAVLEEGLVGIG